MKPDLIITNIGQLVTCASAGAPKRGAAMRDAGIITNGAVAITGNTVTAVGTTDELESNHAEAARIDARGKVVCPGFVDPHTHIVFAGDRLEEFELKIGGAEYLEILENGGGIISTVRQTREASVEELVRQGRRRLDMMLACGTTTAEVKTGYGLDTATELKMLRVIEELDLIHPIDIIPTFLAAHAIPPELKDDPDLYVDLICSEMLPRAWDWYQGSTFPGNGVPFFADVFCERNAFSLDQSRRVLETASSLGFRLKAHVDQFTNLGGSAFAVNAQAASIDHLDAISNQEIDQLAASETVGVVIPTENFNSGKTTFAPARGMIDAGCAVAISTDFNPGSAPCPSQPMAMAISSRFQKLLPAECINASTINAAFACGVAGRAGSIEVGKAADLVFIDAVDHRDIVHTFGGNMIERVMKNGEFVTP